MIHDVCIQNLPVVFAMDRAGIVGDDGRTHQGVFDICLPAPHAQHGAHGAEGRERAAAHALHRPCSTTAPSPCATRAATASACRWTTELQELPIGKAEVLRMGRDLAIVAYGDPVNAALAAAELLAEDGIEAAVINARFAKPIDESCWRAWAATSAAY